MNEHGFLEYLTNIPNDNRRYLAWKNRTPLALPPMAIVTTLVNDDIGWEFQFGILISEGGNRKQNSYFSGILCFSAEKIKRFLKIALSEKSEFLFRSGIHEIFQQLHT